MGVVLFASADSPLKPALAAVSLQNLGAASVEAALAAGDSAIADLEAHDYLAGLGGAPLLDRVLPLDDLKLFAYDMVVFFAGREEAPFPVLPGNPAVVYWDVPDPGPHDKIDGYRALHDRIFTLVRDLLQQGYYRALVQSRKNAELVLDNLHEGILAHDMKRRVFFFNRAAERITGYTRQEVLGRDCHDVFPDRFCRSKCSFCETGSEPVLPSKPYAILISGKSGETSQVEMSVVPIKSFLGNPVGVVASFRDVTREQELASRLGQIEQFAGIIGRDPAMVDIYRTIRDLADSSAAVLIQGESGTGKELVAAAVHNEGNRGSRLFVPVNCGALPENLLESELFGHVRGAFTGAIRDKKGRFELADGGTIFLDEIGDITPAMQVKLLRVLQDGTFQRVGSEATMQVNVRVISATNKDLRHEVARGRFREDLFYRLCVVPLTMPPLRERRNDIPLLADHFLKRLITEEGRATVAISPEALDVLISYDWPGNVRELQNVIRYLLVRCRDDVIMPRHLPPNVLQGSTRLISVVGDKGRRRERLDEYRVRKVLAETDGNKLRAAKLLGVSRATLYRFLEKHLIR